MEVSVLPLFTGGGGVNRRTTRTGSRRRCVASCRATLILLGTFSEPSCRRGCSASCRSTSTRCTRWRTGPDTPATRPGTALFLALLAPRRTSGGCERAATAPLRPSRRRTTSPAGTARTLSRRRLRRRRSSCCLPPRRGVLGEATRKRLGGSTPHPPHPQVTLGLPFYGRHLQTGER